MTEEDELWRGIETALQKALHGVAIHSLQHVYWGVWDAIQYMDDLATLLHNKEENSND